MGRGSFFFCDGCSFKGEFCEKTSNSSKALGVLRFADGREERCKLESSSWDNSRDDNRVYLVITMEDKTTYVVYEDKGVLMRVDEYTPEITTPPLSRSDTSDDDGGDGDGGDGGGDDETTLPNFFGDDDNM